MADIAAPTPPPGAAADWTIDQGWDRYTPEEHQVWLTLYERQAELLRGRACDAFLHGLDALDLRGASQEGGSPRGGIPDLRRVNPALKALTGWTVVCVPGLVPDAVFFDHLANRRFPAGQFIRRSDQLDYLQEPDIFHDLFGHVPMLTDPVFADYMCAYGRGGLRAQGLGQLHHLARLYWYTVEFGLLATPDGLRIYGAGIVSSRAETLYSLEDPRPHRIAFDLERVMRTLYKIDDLQPAYFVAPSLQALLDTTLQDFGGLYDRLRAESDIDPGAVTPADALVAA